MKSVDETRLEEDLDYRFRYLAEFIGFGPEDAAAIHGVAMYLGPMIPQLVEGTYARLLSYDATARHFVPRQHGYEGDLPKTAEQLTQRHPQIMFRKEHLSRYFAQLLGRSFDSKMIQYLNMVGKIHTRDAGNPDIEIPLVQMNALMGLLSDVLMDALSAMPLDPPTAWRTARAFQKLLWIQNDFITRHYQASNPAASNSPESTPPASNSPASNPA